MRLLVLAPFRPQPQHDHAGATALGHLVRALSRYVEIDVLAFQHSDDRPPLREIDVYTTPRLRSREQPLGTRLRSRAQLALGRVATGLPIAALKLRSTALRRQLRQLCVARRPNAVLIESGLMTPYLAELHGIPSLLTWNEIPSPEVGHQGPHSPDPTWVRLARRSSGATLCEARHKSIAAWLRSTAGSHMVGRTVTVRPWPIPVPATPAVPSAAGPVALVYADLVEPALATVPALATAMLERIRAEVPDAELWLAATRPAAIPRPAHAPGLRVFGDGEDLAALASEARLLLALAPNTGPPVHLLEAMAHGIPVIGTHAALRGVDATPPAVELEDDPAALARACIHLLTNRADASRRGTAAREFVERVHADAIVVPRLLDRIRSLDMTGTSPRPNQAEQQR
ncbi:MAG: glycosyltransferase [Planctomycetes bacterium]|nr:glycosyltransferase [Planctomycetota bacterium]